MNINHEATEINQDYIKISSPIPTTVLVTGGTGFLGAYIIENLVKKGHHVIATQGKSQRPFFIPPEIIGKVDWVKGDILDVDFVHEVTKGIDNIIHTAALVSFSAKDRK
ncbi:MAG TPA: NAD-dependent epimerase/dehydratase family protein, partial [Flavisolibacter sp.]|nr:NAD-dependent epimerase/dehydratase family protein [Flavisolibacter sp.]